MRETVDKEAIVKRLLQFESETPDLLDIESSSHEPIASRAGQGELDDRNDPRKHPLRFIFGLIFDQGIGWKRAWSAPSELESRLGSLDVQKIAMMSEEELEHKIRTPKSLHRFPRKLAKWLIEASKLIILDYDGDPYAVWSNGPTVRDLERRFDGFPGIDQKKASMAVNILVRDYGIPDGASIRQLDVSYDIHVRRVFIRTGFVEKDTEKEVVKAARALNPDYPGALDLPSWKVGHNWCHYSKPDCENCPINIVCPKLLNLVVPKGQ